MRTLKPLLVLVALAAVAGCAHPASSIEPTVQAASRQHVASVPSPRATSSEAPETPIEAHVRELASQVIARERDGFDVTIDNLQQHDAPRTYTFDCDYLRSEGLAKVCDYTASGAVDLHARTAKFNHTTKHWCQGSEDATRR